MPQTQLLRELQNQTYVRLKSSGVHGIGVFAIQHIPKGCRNIFSKPIATAEKATTSSEACSVFTTETRAHLANYSGNIPHCPQLNSDPDESSTFCSDRPNRPRSKAPRTIDGSAVNLRSTQLNSNAVSPLRPMKSFHSVMIDSAPTQSAVSSVADVRSNSQVKTNLQNSLTGSYSGCRSILNHK